MPNSAPTHTPPPASRWHSFARASVRAFHAYANWLVGISWKRFFLLALLLLISTGILKDLPPFNWQVSQRLETRTASKPKATDKKAGDGKTSHYEVTIGPGGIRIAPSAAASAAASGVTAGAAPGVPAPPVPPAPPSPPAGPSVQITLPPGADNADVKEAIEEARQAIEDAVAEARTAAEEAAQGDSVHVVSVTLGEGLPQLAFLFILASAILKGTYKGRVQAEVKAAQATETAEAESLKRQVVEARLAAMQAQVEPHFLFNTLASIDHLIETDPPRASAMQKNLIALLRATMPTLREANTGGVRDLGRELAVIQPYLEILKVRMEDRLQTEVQVSEGLRSAEFPPMMIQGLVENAIKHGLEPKPEGGKLSVTAEIVHGRLAVTVADTGLGIEASRSRAATSGTGIGLANIRERLNLLYGAKGTLVVADNPGGGTRATITVPYIARTTEGAAA